MRLSISLLLIAGALLSLGAGLGALQYLRSLEDQLAGAKANLEAIENTADIPVLRRDVARGAALGPEDIDLVHIPVGLIPDNILQTLDFPEDENTPHIALRDLQAGALLLATDLGSAPEQADFGFILSAGARAFALEAGNFDAFADVLSVGDTVDLYWTRTTGDDGPETRLLGAALRILALPGPPSEAEADENGEGATGAAAPRLIVEGRAADVALWLQAGRGGGFDIAPATDPLDLTAAEIVVNDSVLAGLPLVVREGAPGGQDTQEAPAGTATTAEGPLDFIAQLGSSSGEPTSCSLIVVRFAQRSTVEVPC